MSGRAILRLLVRLRCVLVVEVLSMIVGLRFIMDSWLVRVWC